jgi:hypothetical protein
MAYDVLLTVQAITASLVKPVPNHYLEKSSHYGQNFRMRIAGVSPR